MNHKENNLLDKYDVFEWHLEVFFSDQSQLDW